MRQSLLCVLPALMLAAVSASAARPDIDLVAWRGETVFCTATFTNTMERPVVVDPSWSWNSGARQANAIDRSLQDAFHMGLLRPVSWNAKGATVLDRIDPLGVMLPTGGVVTAVGWIVVPRNLPSGSYDFSFGLAVRNCNVPSLDPSPRSVSLTVVDRTLPPAAEWKTYLDLWQHPWAVARVAKAEPFSKAHYDAMRPLWQTLAAAGQKVLTTTIVGLPWNHQCYDGYGTMVRHIKKADGTWTFDYKVFDDYVAFGKGCGIGPDIACYTMCPWGNVVRWEDEKGTEQKIEAKPGSAAFVDYWGPFLKDFAAHLTAKGWIGHTYISMDERAPEDMKKIADFIHTYAPGLKISTAGNRPPSDFKGIVIDNYSQYLEHIDPSFLAEAAARRAEGKITTYYVCCGPARPNTFVTSDPNEAFWVGAYPAVAGLDGLLRWAYNSWPANPAVDSSFGTWPAGDTYLVYPDGSPSIRWLNLLDGLQQGEKLRILRAAGKPLPGFDDLARGYANPTNVPSGAALADLVRRTRELVNAHATGPAW